jgi:serine protease inhibitor
MDLGFALLQKLPGDVVLSPYGLSRALAVIRDGATGRLRETLAQYDAVPEVPGILSAQAAWLGERYSPGPKLTLETGPLDLDRINAWSNEKTKGMIPRILESADPDEIAVITDAEYLKADWQHPFADTQDKPFADVGDVPMMRVDARFEHARDAIRLPYASDDLRMTVMLGEWHEVHWSRGPGVVELPRFSTTSSLDLSTLLDLRGDGHDLDALIEGPGEKELGRVIQRARVDVDEQGTTAAATTAVTIRTVSMPLDPFHLVFDRPFTWAIEHAPTGTLLFAGRVVNPRS